MYKINFQNKRKMALEINKEQKMNRKIEINKEQKMNRKIDNKKHVEQRKFILLMQTFYTSISRNNNTFKSQRNFGPGTTPKPHHTLPNPVKI